MLNIKHIISLTKSWLDNVIIAHNICPFAKKERDRDSIRFYVDENTEISQLLDSLVIECEYLDKHSDIETTLFILTKTCQDFYDYLDFLDTANQLLSSLNYEGTYQLASFHPEYCFAESVENDPANYTNRSLYPMLHIIREKSLEKVLKSYPNPELIPERNINYCRGLGLKKMQKMLADVRLSFNK
jgi:uncharacterized protein